jgi:glutaredoxin
MITIYGMRGCGFCQMAVDKCIKYRLKYEYKDCGIRMFYQELSELNVDMTKMPHILVDKTHIGDYNNLVDYIQSMMENTH